MSKKSLTDKDGNVRELTKEDMKSMRQANDVLPASLIGSLPKREKGQRGPQKKPTKTPVTIRYSPQVINYFKSTGPGWQARMDQVLKEWVNTHTA